MRRRELIFGKRAFQQVSRNIEESMCAHKYRNLLKRLNFLKDADDSLLYIFLINLRPYVLTPGQIIYFEGEVAKGMFIIQKGNIELFNKRTKQLYEKL